MKKALSLILALVMVLAIGATAVSAEGSYKESVVIGLNTPVTSMDEHTTSSTGSAYAATMIYDLLVTLDVEGGNVIKPCLATEWEWNDTLTLTMKLRDDVYFHNGEKFTSDDVVFSFERIKAAGGTGASKDACIETVEAVDDYTVIFHLNTANMDFLSIIGFPVYNSIMNREAVEADPEKGTMIGTGPWMVEEYVPNDYVSFTANENYWGEKPVAKKLKLQYIPEAAARLIALETGEIDVCLDVAGTDVEYASNSDKMDLIARSLGTCVYLAFGTQGEKGSNEYLRLAFAYTLDKQEIIDIAKDGYGDIAVANWGKFTFGLATDMEDYGVDLEKAKEYLAKSGITEITISTKDSANFVDVATDIQAQMAQIGLKVNVNVVEAAALTAMSKYAVHEQEAMIYDYGWGPFGDDARSPYYKDSNVNKATIYDEDIMALIDQAVAEPDEAKRIELYQQVQQINHDKCYYLPLLYSYKFNAVAKGTTGVDFSTTYFDFSYIAVPEA